MNSSTGIIVLGIVSVIAIAAVAVYAPKPSEQPCSEFANVPRESTPARCFGDFLGADGGTVKGILK